MAATNTLGGVNLTAIAQETAKTLLPMLGGLRFFTLDLSNDISEKGAAVVTRVVTAYTAQDLSSGYDAAAVNTTTTAITVTLNTFSGVVLEFTDLEMSKASANLQAMVYEPFANAGAKAVYDLVFSLILNSNFSQKVTVAAASFDSDWLSKVRTVLNKAYVAPGGGIFAYNSDIGNSLRSDNSLKAAYAFGSNGMIAEGEVSRVMGFNLMEFTWLPSNSENLIGFAAGKQGIAFAARRVADPVNWYGQVENITIADVPFQFRAWYDGGAGKHKLSIGCLFGASAAVAGNVCRVVSA